LVRIKNKNYPYFVSIKNNLFRVKKYSGSWVKTLNIWFLGNNFVYKGNNKITEHRAIFQREKQNS
jgi:hypothetical protein